MAPVNVSQEIRSCEFLELFILYTIKKTSIMMSHKLLNHDQKAFIELDAKVAG